MLLTLWLLPPPAAQHDLPLRTYFIVFIVRQEGDEISRDWTTLFDNNLFKFDTSLIPEALALYGRLHVKKAPLTLIPPQVRIPCASCWLAHWDCCWLEHWVINVSLREAASSRPLWWCVFQHVPSLLTRYWRAPCQGSTRLCHTFKCYSGAWAVALHATTCTCTSSFQVCRTARLILRLLNLARSQNNYIN